MKREGGRTARRPLGKTMTEGRRAERPHAEPVREDGGEVVVREDWRSGGTEATGGAEETDVQLCAGAGGKFGLDGEGAAGENRGEQTGWKRRAKCVNVIK